MFNCCMHNGSDESTNPETNALSDEHPNAVLLIPFWKSGSTLTVTEKDVICQIKHYEDWVRVNHPEHLRIGSKSV